MNKAISPSTEINLDPMPRVRLIPFIKAQLPWFIYRPQFGPSYDSLLTALVWQRRIRDQRITFGYKFEWHMAALWGLPEAMIMDVVEKFLVLKSDGFDDQQIGSRISVIRNVSADEETPIAAGIVAITKHHLKLEFPDYPVKLEPLVDHQICIVENYFRTHPEQLATEIAPCPTDWLKNIVRAGRSPTNI